MIAITADNLSEEKIALIQQLQFAFMGLQPAIDLPDGRKVDFKDTVNRLYALLQKLGIDKQKAFSSEELSPEGYLQPADFLLMEIIMAAVDGQEDECDDLKTRERVREISTKWAEERVVRYGIEPVPAGLEGIPKRPYQLTEQPFDLMAAAQEADRILSECHARESPETRTLTAENFHMNSIAFVYNNLMRYNLGVQAHLERLNKPMTDTDTILQLPSLEAYAAMQELKRRKTQARAMRRE